MKNLMSISCMLFTLFACDKGKTKFDASGSFEAVETIIASEASGSIKQLHVEEGQVLRKGQIIGYIDSTQLYLKKKQLMSQINAVLSKKPDVALQVSALTEQLKTSEKEKLRISNLVKGEAATTKQLDDISATIEVLKKQIEAQKSTLTIHSEGLNKEVEPLLIQIEQINDQLAKCKIINPVNGTVLNKYSEENEMTNPGKPVYKIADLTTVILRAYISGNQLAAIKLNQQVKVNTDDGNGGFKQTVGTIVWINEKAEFTPKTIQTKDERANMVYAIKVKVVNNGDYKLGMYGEINFN